MIRTVFLLMLSAIFFSAFSQDVKSHRVGILKFRGNEFSQDKLDALTARFQNELFKINKFQLVEQEKMTAILEEKGLAQTGCTQSDCYIELGKTIGVDRMITSHISSIGKVTTIATKVIDVQTGKILRSAVIDTKDDFEKLIKKDVGILAEKVAGKGKVSESVYEFKLSEKRNPIAVLEVKGNGLSADEAKGLTNRLRSELFNTGKFEVLEREQMSDILQEQGFQQSGMCDEASCLVEVGQLIGVKYMVGGSVTRIGNLYSVSARIIDVSTGKILRTATTDVKGNIETVLKGAMQDIARSLAGLKVETRANKPAIVTLVSGLVVAAGGVPLTMLGYRDWEEYNGVDDDNSLTTELRNSSEAKYLAGYVMYGVGAAAVGTSIILFISKRTKLNVQNSMAFVPTKNGVQLCIKF